jgi:hypothetical protein
MSEYRVVWRIDEEAPDPRRAAELALEAMRDPESTATVFDVFELGTGSISEGTRVDLSPKPHNDPVTVHRVEFPSNLSVHLASAHGIGPGRISVDDALRTSSFAHLSAHLHAEFRPGQEHYHREEKKP